MNEYKIQGETLTALANETRQLTGSTESMSPGEMISTLKEANVAVAQINQVVNELPIVEKEWNLQDKTVIPSSEEQIVTFDDGYDGLSKVTVEGDEDLKPENIKLGVSIFGVEGTFEDHNIEDGLIEGSLSGVYINDRVESISDYAFQGYTSLTNVSFPNCTTIGSSAFASCTSLTNVSFPNCTTIDNAAFMSCTSLTSVSFPNCTNISRATFYNCTSLTSVDFPNCTYIGINAFWRCSSLTSVRFPNCTNIDSSAFYNCWNLSTIILGTSLVCTLVDSKAFISTPYAGYSASYSGTPYIYVPSSLVDAYKSATNWIYFSSCFSAINEEV